MTTRRSNATTIAIAIALAMVSLVLVQSRDAFCQDAQDRPSAVGVGIETTLAGNAGPALVFQTPAFHVEGILAFADQGDNTDVTIAGRFWWAVSQTGRSDFSVGGGLGILINDNGAGSDTDLEFNLGAQLRAFIVPNVAVSATLGLVFISVDGGDNPIALTGGLLGALGVAYFF